MYNIIWFHEVMASYVTNAMNAYDKGVVSNSILGPKSTEWKC